MLFSILLWVIAITLFKLIGNRRKARQSAENAEISDFPALDDIRVHEIIKAAYLDLERQRARAYGPWLSALLDGGPGFYFTGTVDQRGRERAREWRRVEPAVALTAIRFTIRDLAGSRFNLDGLRRAEAELEQMGEGA